VSIGVYSENAGTLTVNKGAGATIVKLEYEYVPKDRFVTVTSATLQSATGQSVEYALGENENVPPTEWSEDSELHISFNGTFWIFTRSKENDDYLAGEVKVGGPVVFNIENLPVEDRWYTWTFPGNNDDPLPTKTTITKSVANDGLCTIVVGGIAEPHEGPNNWGRFKATANYEYTAKAGKRYNYVFEAQTASGSRFLGIHYYNEWDGDGTVLEFHDFEIDSTNRIYTITGEAIPKDRIGSLEFHCADQLGTFYIKIIAIQELEGSADPSQIFYNNVARYNSAASSVTVTVSEDLTLPSVVNVPANSGHILTIRSSNFYSPARTLTRGAGATGDLFTVGDNSSLVLENIIIDGGNISSSGSLVRVDGSSANFEMRNNAVLKNNINSGGSGGGVYVANGSFIMEGGEISNNQANSTADGGGGVFIANGTTAKFTMLDGIISGNSATNGGGVMTMASGTILIVNGTVYGTGEGALSNIATSSGAALFNPSSAIVQHGTFSGTGGAWASNGSLSTTNDTIRVVNGMSPPFADTADFSVWLGGLLDNTSDAPYFVKLNVSDLAGNYSTPGSVGYVLANSGKYISLDLSGSTFVNITPNAFMSGKITSVTLPAGLETIGGYAFRFNTDLTNITIPASVTSIGNAAFANCTGLTSVTFEGSAIIIGDYAFPPESVSGTGGGDVLKTAYLADGAGTYTRDPGGSTWTKQP